MTFDQKTINRVLVLGDVHADIKFIFDAIKMAVAIGAQAIHVVGDFGYWTHTEAGRRFLVALDAFASAEGVLVTFTDGNHENFDNLYEIPVDDDGWRRVMPMVWHAPRGHMWRWSNTNFLSMGGAHSINGPGGVWAQTISYGNDWWPQESITEEEVEHAMEVMADWAEANPYGEVDVMFSHDAPMSVRVPTILPYPMAMITRERLDRVFKMSCAKVLFHGHYHFPYMQDVHNYDMLAPCRVYGLSHNKSVEGNFAILSLPGHPAGDIVVQHSTDSEFRV